MAQTHSAGAVSVEKQEGQAAGANGSRRDTRRLHKDARGNVLAQHWLM
ncbi:hypothetical protein [Roseateles violae]|uniref:Uncharacterized protein n=1 Tax=Roseateles violae TaxID=3058042 RepID=A0ABT8E0G0_9BURK|nr:hypothetical protein [Pelomonas sp. PFR6]MDN3923279.1 hypothetical protein [Pelomonas sp. PFR6]